MISSKGSKEKRSGGDELRGRFIRLWPGSEFEFVVVAVVVEADTAPSVIAGALLLKSSAVWESDTNSGDDDIAGSPNLLSGFDRLIGGKVKDTSSSPLLGKDSLFHSERLFEFELADDAEFGFLLLSLLL